MESIREKKSDAVEVTNSIAEGSGLFAVKFIPEKTTLCDYGGTRLSAKEAKALPGNTPYLFQLKEPTMDHVIFIENEHHHDELSNFISHSSLHLNCKPVVRKWPNNKDVSVIFVSTQPIQSGDQIVWDYRNQYGMEHACVKSCSKCAKKRSNIPKKKSKENINGNFTRSMDNQPEVRLTCSAANLDNQPVIRLTCSAANLINK